MDLASLVGDFLIQEHLVTLAPNVAAPLIGPDPTRWALFFSVGSSGPNYQITTLGNPPSPGGLLISSTAPIVIFNFRDHGALVNLPWNGESTGGAPAVIIEVLYRPSGRTLSLDDLVVELATLRRQSRQIPDHYHRQLSELQAQLSSRPHIGARK